MTTAGLLVARARDAAAILAALGAVVFVATMALALTLGSVQNGVASGSREVLGAAAPRSAAVRIETHLADDSQKQSDAALGMIADLFPVGTVDVHAQQRSLPVDLRGDEPATVVFGVQPALLDGVTIEAGSWPADGAAVQADAAEALGLDVGDELVVGTDSQNVSVAVAALWRAVDPADPVWFADPTFASGRDGEALGTFVVDEDTLRLLPTQLFTSWTITATDAALDDDARDGVVAALARLHDSVRATDDVVDTSSSIDGSLAATLARITDAARGATAIAASALIIIGLLGVIAILQLGTVLVGSRRRQADLARARGLSASQGVVLALGEAAAVAVPATTLGVVVAALALTTYSPPSLVAIGGGVTVATIGCLVAVALLDARTGTAARSASPSPAPFVLGGSVVAAAAAITTWQLYTRSGTSGVDLVGASSPALALVSAAVLGTTLLFPASAAIARSTARGSTVGAVLAARQVSQRVARYLVPVLALAIAVASAVFATGLATTWSSTERGAQFVGAGADVSVTLASDEAAVTSAAYDGIRGAGPTAALVSATVSVGDDSVPFVAVRPRSVERVLGAEGDDVRSALETTTPDDSGIELPAGSPVVTAQVTMAGDGTTPTSGFDVGVWASDADGALSRVALVPGADGWSAPTPAGVAPWRLLSVEVVRTGKPDAAVSTISVSRIAGASGGAVDVDVTAAGPVSIAPISAVDDDTPLPVVVTTALADRLGLDLGDPLSLDFDPTGRGFDAVVVAVTPWLPGVASRLAIGTDLAALDAVTLRAGSTPVGANEIWIATDEPAAVASAVARAATSPSIVSTRASGSSDPVLSPALAAFWLAAAAAAVLAIVALTAFFVDDFRGRRGDVPVLRALGLSSREQASSRGRELYGTLGFASLVGVASGALATMLIVGPFIAATVPTAAQFVRVLPAFDPLPLLAYCAVLAVAAAAVSAVLLGRVRRSASATAVGTDTE